jgi:hypothetical protein
VQVGTETNWAFVSCGGTYTVAAKSDGTLWAWGYNANGQLGNGTTTNSSIPVQITQVTVASVTNTGTVNLIAGWNLVGNSNDAPLNVSSVLGSSANVQTVWKWDTAANNWAFYAPGLTDGGQSYAANKGYGFLQTIQGGQGFWVNALNAFSIQIPGGPAILASSYQPGQVRALPSGWSLVSIGDTKTPSDFDNGLSSTSPASGVAQNVLTLWAWDAAQNGWYFWAPSLVNAGTLSSYIQSKNYLDFTTAGKSLGPGVGFWVNVP